MDLIQIPTTFGRGFIILCSLEMCPTIGTKPLQVIRPQLLSILLSANFATLFKSQSQSTPIFIITHVRYTIIFTTNLLLHLSHFVYPV